MIDAEYDEIDGADGELDLVGTDSLPWLESDEEDDAGSGYDSRQIAAFASGLVLLGAAILGGFWFLTNRTGNADQVADGSLIEAPAGPIKERPEDPGGKQFDGTGNVAPVVGEGGTRQAVVASSDTPPLPNPDGSTQAKPVPATPAVTKPVPVTQPNAAPAVATADLSGVGVQLAAYSSRDRAEKGWSDLSRRTDALSGVKHRVVEGKVDIGTVYRLQAIAADRKSADQLCAALKADGLDCQVKP